MLKLIDEVLPVFFFILVNQNSLNLKATSERVKLFSLFWNCHNHNYSSSLRSAKFTGSPGIPFYIQFFAFTADF